jgi:predicted hotdog family 3-hydroxylacyl-ACP dehydratase
MPWRWVSCSAVASSNATWSFRPAELTIHGLRSLEDDNGMGVFECHITAPASTPPPV